MRYLDFTRDNQHAADLYELVHGGVVSSNRGFDKLETRIIGNVMNKLEAIGVASTEGNRAIFALTKPGIVVLEDTEFRLLLESLESVKWTIAAARRAADMFDWINTTPDAQIPRGPSEVKSSV